MVRSTRKKNNKKTRKQEERMIDSNKFYTSFDDLDESHCMFVIQLVWKLVLE